MSNLNDLDKFKISLKEDYNEGDFLMNLCIREAINLMRNKELVVGGSCKYYKVRILN